MSNYRVLYRSEGILSGSDPGDEVTITDTQDAAHLLGLGLIETEEAYQERKAAAEADEDDPPLTDEQQQAAADKLRQAQEEALKPYAKGGGWYEFPAVGDGQPVRLQGREAAWAEVLRRTAPQQ